MINLTISGRVGADAEILQLSKDRKLVKFSVAHSEQFTNRDGVKQTKTTWVNCAIFRNIDASTNFADWIRKGTIISVSGKPEADAYLSKDGEAVGNLSLIVESWDILNSTKPRE